MPLSRIVINQGRSTDEIKTIADTLYQVMVDEFDVPVDDRFQIIEQCPIGHLIYDDHYQTGARTKDYVLINIVAGKPRSQQQKRRFYSVLSERLAKVADIAPDDVMVVIECNSAENWSFGRGEMLNIR